MRLQHLLLTIGAVLLSKGQGFLLRLTQLLSLKNSGHCMSCCMGSSCTKSS